ncbi:MAG: radical SAM protein [Gemmataceae bacterium]|nr:radical SAM protein [Gemmataceae bacterium]
MLRVAHVAPDTEAEGPGRRFAVWFQGCPLRCPGCCNPEMLPFEGGRGVEVDDLVNQLARESVEGISLLGGEPFAHAPGAAEFAARARALGLSVMVYSGYTLAELRADSSPGVGELLALTDILVDGPYDRSRPDSRRRWVGSENQVVHFFTDRYSPGDECWKRPNTLELRLVDGTLSVNGFPAPAAVGFWRKPA